jgi:hypothetical protein
LIINEYYCQEVKFWKNQRRISVAPDLTRVQQEGDEILRDELKELRGDGKSSQNERKCVKIVRGEIVREKNGDSFFSLGKWLNL